MAKKPGEAALQDILRKRGARQAPVVKPNVTEIRSCGVMGHHDDDDDDDDGEHGHGHGDSKKEGKPAPPKKGGGRDRENERARLHPCQPSLLIIWEYCVEYDRIDPFHDFLASAEPKLAARLEARDQGAHYMGTYVMHAGSTPCYRTMWGYRSQRAMVDFWARAMKDKDPVVGLAKGLREFWLLDPERFEARWIAARNASFSAEDAPFARMTIDTYKEKLGGKK